MPSFFSMPIDGLVICLLCLFPIGCEFWLWGKIIFQLVYTSWGVRAASGHFTLLLSYAFFLLHAHIWGGKNTAGLTRYDQGYLVHSIRCTIGTAIRGSSVLGFPVSSLSDLCGLSICSLWHLRLWTSEPSTNLLETRATSVPVMAFSEPKWPYHATLQDCCCLHQRSGGLKE